MNRIASMAMEGRVSLTPTAVSDNYRCAHDISVPGGAGHILVTKHKSRVQRPGREPARGSNK